MSKLIKYSGQDAQILLTIMTYQDKMSDLLERHESIDEVAGKSYELLEYYVIKVISLTSKMTTKLKKLTPSFMDDEINALIMENLKSSYPVISEREVVKYAQRIASFSPKREIAEVYESLSGNI